MPFGGTLVTVYAVGPGPDSRWVVVWQERKRKSCVRLFVRKGGCYWRIFLAACSKEETTLSGGITSDRLEL